MFHFWTLMDILQNKFIISDKGTINFQGTAPIYKQTNDTRFCVPSMVSKYISQMNGTSRANHWNEHVCMYLYMEHQNVKVLS